MEMKKCNEISAKVFLGSTPKIDGKMQYNFTKDAERWWKIAKKAREAVFVFILLVFTYIWHKNATKILEQTVSLWTL